MRERRKHRHGGTLEEAMADVGIQFRVVWFVILDVYEDMVMPVLNAMAFYIGVRKLMKRTPRDALYDTLLWIKRNPTQGTQRDL